MMRVRFVAIVAIAFVLPAIPAPAPAAGVSTFAGSGAAGIADGPAASASFLEPEGLAIAPNGDAYVADAAAQRIRRISPAGVVSTVAGSGSIDASHLYVRGGFADGPAATARFDQPSAVAISTHGAIVVADRGNHCLREIAGGKVSTFAGQCRASGNADGANAAARFTAPLGLAYDSSGTLYVADYGTGIRKVAPGGTTSTLHVPSPWDKHVDKVTGVSVYEGHGKRILWAATDDGVLYVDLDDSTSVAFYEAEMPESQNDANVRIEGYRFLGEPYAVVGISPTKIVYTDISTNAVRFVSDYLAGTLAGQPSENEQFAAGGFRDGSTGTARLDAPMGIARRGDGSFLVSDSGNRRIRLVRDAELRHLASLDDLAAGRRFYRIVYIGDSAVAYDQNWDESIAGILERKLRANAKTLGFPRPPRVYPIWLVANLDSIGDYVNQYLSTGLADMVVLNLNSGLLYNLVDAQEPANLVPLAKAWRPIVTRDVRTMANSLRASHIPFTVAITPLPYEVSPFEATYYLNTVDRPAPLGEYAPLGGLYTNAVNAAGVTSIDMFPAFSAIERQPDRPALFGTRDEHLSVDGAALVANLLYANLERTRPWKR